MRHGLTGVPVILNSLNDTGVCQLAKFGCIRQFVSGDETNRALAVTNAAQGNEEELDLLNARQARKNLRKKRLRDRSGLCWCGEALEGVNVTHGGLLGTSP